MGWINLLAALAGMFSVLVERWGEFRHRKWQKSIEMNKAQAQSYRKLVKALNARKQIEKGFDPGVDAADILPDDPYRRD